jgi:serine/threonine-protein kinase
VSEILSRLQAALVDRYAIQRELGRGGMATVYLAKDLKHDREVAIKVLHPELAATIGPERFDREIRIAAKLQHPNILGLFDSGEADGLLYYVMPFIYGESLRDKLNRDHMLPVEQAVHIALEVADALGYAHSLGIIHRDIKPENIMLSGGHALVADFGIARAASAAGGSAKLTETGMAVGTPLYMSPEQAVGEQVGPTADLYSLGCVLFEMLTGHPPFTGTNARQIMARHAMEPVPSIQVVRDTVPDHVEDAVMACLNKVVADRPPPCRAEPCSGFLPRAR